MLAGRQHHAARDLQERARARQRQIAEKVDHREDLEQLDRLAEARRVRRFDANRVLEPLARGAEAGVRRHVLGGDVDEVEPLLDVVRERRKRRGGRMQRRDARFVQDRAVVCGEPDEVLVARPLEDALLEHLVDAPWVIQRVTGDGDAPVAVERIETERRDRVERVPEPQLAAAHVNGGADANRVKREGTPEQILAQARQRRVLAEERTEDVGRRVEADLRLFEELLEGACVVIRVAMGEDHAVDRLRGDAARMEVVGRIGRRVDEDRAAAHPQEEAGGLSADVEAMARAEHGNPERRRDPRRRGGVRVRRRHLAR